MANERKPTGTTWMFIFISSEWALRFYFTAGAADQHPAVTKMKRAFFNMNGRRAAGSEGNFNFLPFNTILFT